MKDNALNTRDAGHLIISRAFQGMKNAVMRKLPSVDSFVPDLMRRQLFRSVKSLFGLGWKILAFNDLFRK